MLEDASALRLSALLVMVACALLAACGRDPEIAKADHKVLCDPATGDAYMVRPGGGDISFVRPVQNGAGLCKKYPDA